MPHQSFIIGKPSQSFLVKMSSGSLDQGRLHMPGCTTIVHRKLDYKVHTFNLCRAEFFQETYKIYLYFFLIIFQHWQGTGNWIPSLKGQGPVYPAQSTPWLSPEGTIVSATMVLTLFSWNIPVSVKWGLTRSRFVIPLAINITMYDYPSFVVFKVSFCCIELSKIFSFILWIDQFLAISIQIKHSFWLYVTFFDIIWNFDLCVTTLLYCHMLITWRRVTF